MIATARRMQKAAPMAMPALAAVPIPEELLKVDALEEEEVLAGSREHG
jgi:hypothetical protein